MGKAVVSTTVGAEGLPVADGEHVSSPTSPPASRARWSRLLRDADRRRATRSGGPRARRGPLRLVGRGGRARRRRLTRRPSGSGRARPTSTMLSAAVPAAAQPAGTEPTPRVERCEVSVFGLGYVGSVSAASFADDGHEVVGVDVNADKVAAINAGPQPDRRARPRRAARRDATAERPAARDDRHARKPFATRKCRCSASARRAARTAASISPTSSASATQIGAALRDKRDYHVVVVRSTVLPGTTHEVVIPALERASGKTYGEGFGVSVNPEFLREGTALKDFRKPPLTLVGHNHAADASGTIALYQAIDAPLVSTSIRVAEMMKYTSNTWHALKVVLRQRDRQPVQEARRRQPRGDGHLLPRREAEPVVVLPEAGLRIRRIVPAEGRARAAVPRERGGRRAAGDLADPAEQPAADPARARPGARDRQEEGRPARVQLQGRHRRSAREPDRHPRRGAARQGTARSGSTTGTSRIAKLVGANKEYIEQQIPHLSSLLCDTIEEVIDGSEVIVVGNQAPEFAKALESHATGSDRHRSRAAARLRRAASGRIPRHLLVTADADADHLP